MDDIVYSSTFYNRISDWSSESAKIIVPFIIDLINPTSIVDVGCGDGTWLREFQNAGVKNILGLDGDYVSTNILKIDPNYFMPCDLLIPPQLKQKYDMALCLEVAEHLPFEYSHDFVDYLTSLSNIVLFSAGVPYQPGVNHINGQWQSFWNDIFVKKNYRAITTIREKIWEEPTIPYFYKQNIVLYVNEEAISHNATFQAEVNISKAHPLNIIHPDYYLALMDKLNEKRKELSFSEILRFHVNRRIRYWKHRIITR